MLLDLSRSSGVHDHIERTIPPNAWQTSEDFAVRSPAQLVFDIFRQKDDVRLVGRVATTIELDCVRCLEPFEWPIDAPFDVRYQPFEANSGEGEREVQEGDLDTSFYKDGVIDLEHLMREQFYLSLPMKPLCAADCKGLCALCGANLNQTACACTPVWQDPRLAAFRGLLDRK